MSGTAVNAGKVVPAAPSFSADALAELNADFEWATATEIIRWAVSSFQPHFCMASSMTDVVLVDLAVRVDPTIEVVFIDTGYHFRETLETMERARRQYGLNLRIMTVAPHDTELWKVDPERCCSEVKRSQLDVALAGKWAWMSGLRRVEAPTRTTAPIVALDQRGLIKLNPLARWTDDDVNRYIDKHQVPTNPLRYQGYRSIGCAPCTRPVGDDEHPRAGRWAGSEKTECGLHL
ncbi:MAG: phosphoadenylyl-sulfate reductase [Actinomycetota bacterium]|nr:phosphoadenylyl-sulfate reductase [Actinomycetota bacterium]